MCKRDYQIDLYSLFSHETFSFLSFLAVFYEVLLCVEEAVVSLTGICLDSFLFKRSMQTTLDNIQYYTTRKHHHHRLVSYEYMFIIYIYISKSNWHIVPSDRLQFLISQFLGGGVILHIETA